MFAMLAKQPVFILKYASSIALLVNGESQRMFKVHNKCLLEFECWY